VSNDNVGVHSTANPDEGFVVLRLKYTADDEKDAKWAAKAKLEYASDDWSREFELQPVGSKDSYPVFVDYRRSIHEDTNLVWLPSQGKVIYRGWDFGKVHPCVEFAQVIGLRKNFIDEIYEDHIMIEQLIQKVLANSNQNFPGCTFVDWVDVSGRNEDQWGNSSMASMRKYGLHPRGKDQTVEEGIQAIKKDLVMLDAGRPYFMLNPAKCPHLAQAMRGGYKRSKKGDLIKDGENDHPPDAARYLIQGLTYEKVRDWTDLAAKMKNQYNKFPSKGRTIRR
jgi:hypothetical protein